MIMFNRCNGNYNIYPLNIYKMNKNGIFEKNTYLCTKIESMIDNSVETYMNRAIQLARLGKGFVDPNPLVGAVIVRDGKILAEGYHHCYGDLHAERDAFRMADENGIDCSGAEMYVTLEPCCHYGKQPPCTEAIIAHKISKVYVGLLDPNPLVAGKGLQILEDAGIECVILEDMFGNTLRYENRVFLKYITQKRPWVHMKYAMTLDGKIATHNGDSKWISNEASREIVQQLRSDYPGILCGIGTVLADDPMLNCRMSGNHRQPVRIVADSKARIPMDCQLVKTADIYRTVIAHNHLASHDKLEALHAFGVETWLCNGLDELLERAATEKISGILLEGGGTLNESFLTQGLVDEITAFIAPKLIGGALAKSPIEGLGFPKMSDAILLDRMDVSLCEGDVVLHGLIKK